MKKCADAHSCPCPNKDCPNNGNCRACVAKHRATDSQTYCMFPNNGGDKSNRNFFEALKKKFENGTRSK